MTIKENEKNRYSMMRFFSKKTENILESKQSGARAMFVISDTMSIQGWLALCIILGIALMLRVYHLDYMEFKHDEAINSFKALKMAQGLEIPLSSGRSSVGIEEFPIFMYLLSIPYLFTSNPIYAAAFIALLNVATIGLSFWFVREFFHPTAAWLTIILMTVSPWHILFSRKIWTQNTLPFFSILLLILFFLSIYRKRQYLLVTGFVLGITVQLHLSAMYLVLVALILLWYYRHELNFRLVSGSIILSCVPFIPFIIFQVQNNFKDIRLLLVSSDQPYRFDTYAFQHLSEIITTHHLPWYSFRGYSSVFNEGWWKILPLDYLVFLLFLFGLFCLIRVQREEDDIDDSRRKKFVLFLWIAIGYLYLAIGKTSSQHHYYQSFIPLQYIAIGLALHTLFQRFLQLRIILIFLVGLIFIYQLSFGIHFLQFIAQSHPDYGDYGTPFHYHLQKVKREIAKMESTELQQQFETVRQNCCICPKCDYLATRFLAHYLMPESELWP